MATDVSAGYIGLAEVDGVDIRCTDFNVNPKQEVKFYDHVIGLNDTVPDGDATKGEEVGVIQTQRRIWRPGTIDISGSLSYPATEDNVDNLFEHAKYGTYINSMRFMYHCDNLASGKTRAFTRCRVGSFTLRSTGGDFISITADLTAQEFEDIGSKLDDKDPVKIITWDNVDVTTSSGIIDNDQIQGIEFKINNNLSSIYTAEPGNGMSDLGVKDLRLGMQSVSGKVDVYLKPDDLLLSGATAKDTINISFSGFSTQINVVFEPLSVAGVVGPVIASIPFEGVDKAFGI